MLAQCQSMSGARFTKFYLSIAIFGAFMERVQQREALVGSALRGPPASKQALNLVFDPTRDGQHSFFETAVPERAGMT